MTSLAKAFALQAGWCRALGSPFMGELMDRLRADVESEGLVHELLRDWPGEPLADALSLRLAGALHNAVLTGRDPSLAAEYPAAREDWSMDRVWPRAHDFLARERGFVEAFLEGAPQTNETRRTIALLPGFLLCAAEGPLHLLEIGASAGLNQHWDRFRYETRSWRWGGPAGPLVDTDWRGPPPAALEAQVTVASRAGCDLNPLDVRDDAQRLRLKSYVWPDQPDRMARLDAAIALSENSAPPEKADAGEWLARRLAGTLPQGVTVIFHSVVWQYLPAATKAAAEAAIEAAARRASSQRRLAWLRFEPNAILSSEGAIDGMGVDLAIWPGGERRRLCDVDGHARAVTHLGSANDP